MTEMLRASWSRLRDMPHDVPATLRLLVDDVRERPQSHALIALVTFVGTAAVFYCSAWLLVEFVL